jgi:hypothetical protein
VPTSLSDLCEPLPTRTPYVSREASSLRSRGRGHSQGERTPIVRNWLTTGSRSVFPEHALLIVEERLREQEAEGVRMPDAMPLDELALRILVAVHHSGWGAAKPSSGG